MFIQYPKYTITLDHCLVLEYLDLIKVLVFLKKLIWNRFNTFVKINLIKLKLFVVLSKLFVFNKINL